MKNPDIQVTRVDQQVLTSVDLIIIFLGISSPNQSCCISMNDNAISCGIEPLSKIFRWSKHTLSFSNVYFIYSQFNLFSILRLGGDMFILVFLKIIID